MRELTVAKWSAFSASDAEIRGIDRIVTLFTWSCCDRSSHEAPVSTEKWAKNVNEWAGGYL